MEISQLVTFRNGIFFGFYLVAFFSAISISISQIGLGIVLVCWLGVMVQEKKFIFTNTALSKPIGLYIVVLIISSLFGVNVLNSLYSMRDFWICLLFFSLVTFIDEEKIVNRLILFLFTGTILASIYGIVQVHVGGLDLFRPKGEEVIQMAYLQHPNEVIAIGFFNHHLTFAEVILFSLCLSTTLMLWNWGTKNEEEDHFSMHLKNILYVFITIIFGLALLFSYARGSWIAYALTFFLLLFLKKDKSSVRIGIAFIAIITATIIFHQPTRGRVTSILNQQERLYIWKIALEFASERPITGIGLNNWEGAIDPKIEKLKTDNIFTFADRGVTQHAHNNLLTRLAEEGILGAASFIYLFVVIFMEGARFYKKISTAQRRQRGIMMGFIGGVAAFHFAGLFENTFGDSEVVMVLWLVTGLMFVCGKIFTQNFYPAHS